MPRQGLPSKLRGEESKRSRQGSLRGRGTSGPFLEATETGWTEEVAPKGEAQKGLPRSSPGALSW